MHLFLIERLNLTFAARIIYLTVTYCKFYQTSNVRNSVLLENPTVM